MCEFRFFYVCVWVRSHTKHFTRIPYKKNSHIDTIIKNIIFSKTVPAISHFDTSLHSTTNEVYLVSIWTILNRSILRKTTHTERHINPMQPLMQLYIEFFGHFFRIFTRVIFYFWKLTHRHKKIFCRKILTHPRFWMHKT